MSKPAEKLVAVTDDRRLNLAFVQPSPSGTCIDPATAHLLAERALKIVTMRYEIFGPIFGSDPPWRILTALYLSELRATRYSLTDLYGASDLPFATANRWTVVLAEANLVKRLADENDRRRTYIELEPQGRSLIDQYFVAIAALS